MLAVIERQIQISVIVISNIISNIMITFIAFLSCFCISLVRVGCYS